MVDKDQVFNVLKLMKVGGRCHFEGIESREVVVMACRDFSKEFRASIYTAYSDTGIEVIFGDILPGSILRVRKSKPWHGLQVGESRHVSTVGAPKIGSLRAYVSMYATKAGQTISVTKATGGFTITRKA